MENCIFCKIVKGQIPANVIYEDQFVLAFLDIGPLNEGHSLVIPKEHIENFSQFTDDILTHTIKISHKVALAVQKVTSADGYNLLCNNGKAAGQLVNHVHFHIIPRFEGDGVFDKWPAKEYPEGKAAEIAKKISENI